MTTDPAAPPRPGSGIEVRRAGPHELDDAGQAVLAAYLADGLPHGDYDEVLVAARDRARDAEVVVAVGPSGRVLGCVTFVLPGSRWAELAGEGEAEFRMLGVRPEARGHAIGTALVEWCLRRAADLGCRRVVICSPVSMPAAHHLYTRLGFVRRPDLDWCPHPGVQLLGFSVDVTPGAPGRGSAPGPRRPG